MTKEKLETLKDIEIPNWIKDILKSLAIKWFLHGIKKKKNLAKMFLDFFNITDEELYNGK